MQVATSTGQKKGEKEFLCHSRHHGDIYEGYTNSKVALGFKYFAKEEIKEKKQGKRSEGGENQHRWSWVTCLKLSK